MKWFSNLFKNKSSNPSETGKNWIEGHRFFELGKEFYFIKRLPNEGLQYFDKAIANGFEENVFNLRAGCLQELDYHYEAIEDFNKAISLSPNDCNIYFCRSISKNATLDYEGQIADLIKAIELSQVNNEMNRIYNESAKKNNLSKNGILGLFQTSLDGAQMDFDMELEDKERIINASSLESKAFLQKRSDEDKERKLKLIKRR